MRKRVQRLVIIVHGKVRPQHRRENKFRVCVLVKQEIAQPLFSTGPDQQIHVRLPPGIQMIGNRLFRNLFFPDVAVPYQCGYLLRRHDQFSPAAVVHSNIQPESRVFPGPVFRLNQRFPLFFRQPALVAQNQDPDIFRVQLINLGGKEVQDQLHQCSHFLFGAVPVFRGKSIQTQCSDSQIIRMADNLPQGFRTLPMAPGHVQLMLLGPAAVSVHDNGHVLRQLFKFIRCPRRLLQCQGQCSLQLHAFSLSHILPKPASRRVLIDIVRFYEPLASAVCA